MIQIPVRVLRELFRHLQAWNSLYETEGKDSITGPDGTEYCIHDVVRLYEIAIHGRNEKGKHFLSPRQREAISLFLIQNKPEREVARIMGVSEDNPVASYATQGLVRLNELIESGTVPGFSFQTDLEDVA
ncbi:sigma-70 region 4 domain-containing protein [Streptomyces sp. NPDC088752]|uniref:RNA polymerase sigma factor n=1 Tax=Streptomyces sp. NPDC088752 TaxID=3154963 RepID=UPI003427117C